MESDENKNDYVLYAKLLNDPKEMTLGNYEDILYTLYPDANPILPVYSNYSQLEQDLLEIILHDPRLSITFAPEAIVTINSIGGISAYNDSSISFTTKRNNTVISTNGTIFAKDLSALFSLKELKDQGIYLSDTLLSITPQAITTQSTIQTLCSSEICTIINSSLTSDKLSGNYYPIGFYMTTNLTTIQINEFSLYNCELRIYLPENQIIVRGVFDIQVESTEFISFDTNLTSSSGKV